MQDWLVSGWVDVILCSVPAARIDQQVYPIAPNYLVLHSDRLDNPIAYDLDYVFVDYGEDYRRAHGEAHYDVGAAKISFDPSVRAHEYLREIGGSAYLPSYMAVAEVAKRPLIVSKAPVFQRLVCIISHNIPAQKCLWFANLITHV